MFLHTIQIRKNRSLDAKKKGFQKVETERKKIKKRRGGAARREGGEDPGEEALEARKNPSYHIIDAWRSVHARGCPGHDAKTGNYEELRNTKQHDSLPFLKLP